MYWGTVYLRLQDTKFKSEEPYGKGNSNLVSTDQEVTTKRSPVQPVAMMGVATRS